MTNISSLPVFLLVTSILLFSVSPLSNWVSRYQEVRADSYAIEMTQNKDAGVQTFQSLTKAGLSQINPPYLVKILDRKSTRLNSSHVKISYAVFCLKKKKKKKKNRQI